MRNSKGQFAKGHRSSRATEFKKGRHWRHPKPYWQRDWLLEEYATKGRSATEIAAEFGCHENNILYFLHKHEIHVRSISEARQIKRWGLSGPANGMYGKTGASNPNWRGGCSPERQALYSSREWAVAVKHVWQRDQAMCQRCGMPARGRGKFHIHHIVPFSVEESRTNVENLMLLCPDCHFWVHSKDNSKGEFVRPPGP